MEVSGNTSEAREYAYYVLAWRMWFVPSTSHLRQCSENLIDGKVYQHHSIGLTLEQASTFLYTGALSSASLSAALQPGTCGTLLENA